MLFTLLGLFGTSLLAATLLPGGSEAALLLAFQQGWAPPLQLWLAASLGNTLGGLITFAMGWQAARLKTAEELVQSPRQQKVVDGLQHYGYWALLLSWLPVIGDLLCLASGWLRMPPMASCLALLIGKASRYALVLWLGQALF